MIMNDLSLHVSDSLLFLPIRKDTSFVFSGLYLFTVYFGSINQMTLAFCVYFIPLPIPFQSLQHIRYDNPSLDSSDDRFHYR